MKIDRDLVSRLEHSSAVVNSHHAAAMAMLAPGSGATSQPFDGGALVALGPGRYVNRAVGVGLGGTPASEVVDAIDAFYGDRGMAPSMELAPWADRSLVTLLGARGYRVEWFRNVFAARLPVNLAPLRTEHRIDRLTEQTASARKSILAGDAAPGSDARRTSDEMCDLAFVPHDSHDFVALIAGETVACGSIDVADGIGWFGGAATAPAHRGKGLQTALLHHRLRVAHDSGLDLAAATALPDGQSAANLLSVGFQLLYTQAVVTRDDSENVTRGSRAGA